MDFENPVIAIESLHQGFRVNIRKHCSAHVIKLRWMNKLTQKQAYNSYIALIKENNTFHNWEILLNKSKKAVLNEYNDMCDNWMLEKLADFDLYAEIKQAFDTEWGLLGPPPKAFY